GPRQRVVLAQDGGRRCVSGFERAPKRRLDAGDPPLDLEALLVEEFRQPCRGLDLVIGELRIVVNLSRQPFEIGRKAVDGRSDEIFDSAHGESPDESIRPRRGRRTLYTGARMAVPRWEKFFPIPSSFSWPREKRRDILHAHVCRSSRTDLSIAAASVIARGRRHRAGA